ncbi:hypothetical protein MAA_11432 [Metarhizium robertsii ARSEF 23]|nr:uncharacterized protein MAA_11432 [Metarhizium robertsii ARSEF 23]KHO10895.1 hypothetical protein MAA_11432 [Metarhizium robertsii ARSEF 23]
MPSTSPLHSLWEGCYRKENNRPDYGRDFTFLQRRGILSHLAEKGDELIILAFLLSSDKVDVDSKDKTGRTPLSRAAEKGHEAVVKLLLETGRVNVEVKDNFGGMPLSRAAQNGHEAVVKLLLEMGRSNVEAKDTSVRRRFRGPCRTGMRPSLSCSRDSYQGRVTNQVMCGRRAHLEAGVGAHRQ